MNYYMMKPSYSVTPMTPCFCLTSPEIQVTEGLYGRIPNFLMIPASLIPSNRSFRLIPYTYPNTFRISKYYGRLLTPEASLKCTLSIARFPPEFPPV